MLTNPTFVYVSKCGAYTGDGTANRAIPHGLGKAPSFVKIVCPNPVSTLYQHFSILQGDASVYPNNDIERAVTAMNATNFYVGNAGSYDGSANSNLKSFVWTALP